MTDSIFPWRAALSLAQVLAQCKPWLEENRLVLKGGGYSDTKLTALERPPALVFPADVREFYRTMRPNSKAWLTEKGPTEFCFFEPDTPSCAPLKEEGYPDFDNAVGLPLGQTQDGDVFAWVRGHRRLPDGCIVMTSHEGGRGPLGLFIIARSLKELIAKIVFLRGLSPGASDVDDESYELGSVDRFLADEDEETALELFKKEYEELNPQPKG